MEELGWIHSWSLMLIMWNQKFLVSELVLRVAGWGQTVADWGQTVAGWGQTVLGWGQTVAGWGQTVLGWG